MLNDNEYARIVSGPDGYLYPIAILNEDMLCDWVWRHLQNGLERDVQKLDITRAKTLLKHRGFLLEDNFGLHGKESNYTELIGQYLIDNNVPSNTETQMMAAVGRSLDSLREEHTTQSSVPMEADHPENPGSHAEETPCACTPEHVYSHSPTCDGHVEQEEEEQPQPTRKTYIITEAQDAVNYMSYLVDAENEEEAKQLIRDGLGEPYTYEQGDILGTEIIDVSEHTPDPSPF